MKRLAFLALTVLAGCAAEDRFISAPQVTATERVASRFSSIEVREVSLPTHASSEEIYVEAEGGGLAVSELLWADDPTRAVTLALSRNLAEITGARVAPEPWPFDAYPAARVDVRVERFLSQADGMLVLAGQYFVADLDGRGRDRARLFSLSAPLANDLTPSAAAEARARLVTELALKIARDGL
ncbi:MAG: PqiC family protein [Silicimonas sp.]